MDSNGSHKPLVDVSNMSQEQIENMLRQMAEMRAEMESYKKELYGLRQVVKGQSSVILPQASEEATSRRKLLKRVAAGAAGLGALALVANVSQVAMADTPGDTAAEGVGGPDGYGFKASGGAAPLYLVPSASAGSPTTTVSARNVGELYVDSAGELFLCIVGGLGTAAKWRNIAGPTTAGALHYLQPVPNRYGDTRNSTGNINGRIAAGGTKTLTIAGAAGERTPFTVIPANTVGIVGNVTVIASGATPGGLLKILPAGGDPTNATATINYPPSSTVANSFNVGLGTSGGNAGKISISCFGNDCDFVIDVVGYYL